MFYLGVSQIEGHQEGIPVLQKISLNSQARFSTAAVWIQEDLCSAGTFHKTQRRKGRQREKVQQGREISHRGQLSQAKPNLLGVSQSGRQPGTGQLPNPGRRKPGLLPQH